MIKKYLRILGLTVLCLMLWGCQSQKEDETEETVVMEEEVEEEPAEEEEEEETPEPEETEEPEDTTSVLGGNIGILFPTEDNAQQVSEAEQIRGELAEANYETELLYAGGDGKTQADQLAQMVTDQKNCIIILPISEEELAPQLAEAAKQGITVISYDRLIGNTEDISYYVGFSDYEIGMAIASHIINDKRLDSAKSDRLTYTIEFFMGALDDENQQQQFQGMMDVLQPYFDEGVLACQSLRLSYEDVSIAMESEEIAYQTCVNIMQANYMDSPVDIVVVGTDALAAEVISALSDQKDFADQWPMVVGSEGTIDDFARIADGVENMTVYDYRDNLGHLCAQLADQVIQGEDIKLSGTVNNGVTEIDAVFGQTKEVYADNYQQVMRDAGLEME